MDLFILLQVFTLFIFPVLLLCFKIIPISQRFSVFVIIFLIILGTVIQEKWAFTDLGIRFDNISQSLMSYAVFTFAGVAFVLFLAKFLKRNVQEKWWTKPHFLFLFIPISVIQEFIYRGFLMPKLEMLFDSSFLIIISNGLIFAFLHIIYRDEDRYVALPLIFFAGVGFAAMYYFYPNLFLISASHSVLNFVAVLYSFYSKPKQVLYLK